MAIEGAPSAAFMESTRYDVAVVDPDARQRMRLGTALAGAAQFGSIEELGEHLRPNRPVVAVFGPGLAVAYGFQQVSRLLAVHPQLAVVFAVEEISTEVLQAAIRAGARDTVSVADAQALSQAVARVGDRLETSTTRPPAVAERQGAPGRLIAVFSPKGGVGKSTVAINVAVAMARRTRERVALVDADLQFGDVAVLLGLPPQHTVLDAAAQVQNSDSEMLAALLTRHDSGLLVLPAPTDAVLGAPIRPDEMSMVCNALQSLCGYVVVDLPTQFDDVVFSVVEAADEVLLVGSLDIPSVKNLKIGMQALDLASVAGSKLRLVLNRANTQVKLDIRDVEQVLGLRAEFPIPSDIAVPMSVNAGVPVVDYEPRCAATRALEHIAATLMGAPSEAASDKKRRAKRARR